MFEHRAGVGAPSSPDASVQARQAERGTVALVVTCFNHARYLPEAIDSGLRQTCPFDEIIVVDDGSTDDTRDIARRYPEGRYLWQPNGGLAAARNRGLQAATSAYVVFLDADDTLAPDAVLAGLACHDADQVLGLVYGHFRCVREDGSPLDAPAYDPCPVDAYAGFLRRNLVGMHATVMYRREALLALGGFDESLRACEDYDVYLRMSRRYGIRSHDTTIAQYRKHAGNMSNDARVMLAAVRHVLGRQARLVGTDRARWRALEEGRRNWSRYYGARLVDLAVGHMRERRWSEAARASLAVLSRAPGAIVREGFLRIGLRRIKSHLSALVQRRAARRPAPPAAASRPGSVDMGDLRRLAPLSREFGFDRGQPIDRYYIEQFLTDNAARVQGRVLEVGGRDYTERFGAGRVTRSDVLNVHHDDPQTTIVADLTHGEGIADASFDCLIITQTLHLIFDVPAAVRTFHRILKPGGTLLLTVPGTISQLEQGIWRSVWYWGFTRLSIERLFGEVFPQDGLAISVYGNVLTSVAFLQGLVTQELTPQELDHRDPLYPLVVTVRATRPRASRP